MLRTGAASGPKVQTGRRAAGVASPKAPHALPIQLDFQGIKGLTLVPPLTFLSGALGSQTLHAMFFRSSRPYRGSQQVAVRAQGEAQARERPEKTLHAHLRPILSRGTTCSVPLRRNSDKTQQTLGKG